MIRSGTHTASRGHHRIRTRRLLAVTGQRTHQTVGRSSKSEGNNLGYDFCTWRFGDVHPILRLDWWSVSRRTKKYVKLGEKNRHILKYDSCSSTRRARTAQTWGGLRVAGSWNLSAGGRADSVRWCPRFAVGCLSLMLFLDACLAGCALQVAKRCLQPDLDLVAPRGHHRSFLPLCCAACWSVRDLLDGLRAALQQRHKSKISSLFGASWSHTCRNTRECTLRWSGMAAPHCRRASGSHCTAGGRFVLEANEKPPFLKPPLVGVEFPLFFAVASCSNSQDNMLTAVSSSTIRTVIGSQFVREKLSVALLFWRENMFSEATSCGR